MRRNTILMALAIVGLGASASAAPIIYQTNVGPTGSFVAPDTTIRADNPTYNYGGSYYLFAGGMNNGAARTLLSFKLNATGGLVAGDQIASVKLTLTEGDAGGTSWNTLTNAERTLTVYRLTAAFSQGSENGAVSPGGDANWTIKYGTSTWATPGGDYSNTSPLSTVVSKGVSGTSDVFSNTASFVAAAQYALDNGGTLNLIITAPASVESGTNFVRFIANTGNSAKLEVTKVVPEPATGVLILLGGIGALAMRRRK